MKTEVNHLPDGRTTVFTVPDKPDCTRAVLRDVNKSLGKLDLIYEKMRENGDSDLRTVLFYLRNAVDDINKINY